MRAVNPLLAPTSDSPALGLFREHFGLPSETFLDASPESLLEAVARSFARIPYENLTKIVKDEREGAPERARRGPLEVLRDHIELGTGGTCFSLTAAMLHVLRGLGFSAEPLLADRPYGVNTHCAITVDLNGSPHLIDPGFLIVKPIPLEITAETRIETPFNELTLLPGRGGTTLELSTAQDGRRTPRITFKTDPVDSSELLRAWDASFEWDMMRYPLLTRVQGGRQLYLQGNRFQIRTRAGAERRRVDATELPRLIEEHFGLRSTVAVTALEALGRKGEVHAGAFAR